MNDVACLSGSFADKPKKYRDTSLYPSLSRPHGVLTVVMFSYIQRNEARQILQAVIEECRRRYLYSCKVLGAPEPSFGHGVMMIDLSPLVYPWDKLCTWYRNTIFRRQFDLFECPYMHELNRWRSLLRERCLEPLCDHPQRVRLLLASVGLIKLNEADNRFLEDLDEDIPEPIFGWAIAEHKYRPWHG